MQQLTVQVDRLLSSLQSRNKFSGSVLLSKDDKITRLVDERVTLILLNNLSTVDVDGLSDEILALN